MRDLQATQAINPPDAVDKATREPIEDLPSAAQVAALIRHRRTIKPADMSDRPIDRELILTILEAGTWAPSHGLTEPWRFRVFTGESRGTLADALQDIYQRTTPEETFRESKFAKLRTLPHKAPACIVVWMKRQQSGKIPEIEEVEAVACALQNMHLLATANGMAAFWSSPSVVYTPEMNQWLGIDAQDRCLGIFYLGWPREDLVWPSRPRNPVTEKTTWVGD